MFDKLSWFLSCLFLFCYQIDSDDELILAVDSPLMQTKNRPDLSEIPNSANNSEILSEVSITLVSRIARVIRRCYLRGFVEICFARSVSWHFHHWLCCVKREELECIPLSL